MENRYISEKYTEIGERLIREKKELSQIAESDVDIIFLESDAEKKSGGKIVNGQCEKVPDKYKWAVPCDFTITVFQPNVERFTDKQIEILLLHELLHVGIEKDGNEEKYFVVPHDIEDFELIITQYGMSWSD